MCFGTTVKQRKRCGRNRIGKKYGAGTFPFSFSICCFRSAVCVAFTDFVVVFVVFFVFSHSRRQQSRFVKSEDGWEVFEDPEGRTFYYSMTSGEYVWDTSAQQAEAGAGEYYDY